MPPETSGLRVKHRIALPRSRSTNLTIGRFESRDNSNPTFHDRLPGQSSDSYYLHTHTCMPSTRTVVIPFFHSSQSRYGLRTGRPRLAGVTSALPTISNFDRANVGARNYEECLDPDEVTYCLTYVPRMNSTAWPRWPA